MSTSSPLPYVSEVFEDVYATEFPVKPVPKRVLLISVIVGFFGGIFISILFNYFSSRKINLFI